MKIAGTQNIRMRQLVFANASIAAAAAQQVEETDGGGEKKKKKKFTAADFTPDTQCMKVTGVIAYITPMFEDMKELTTALLKRGEPSVMELQGPIAFEAPQYDFPHIKHADGKPDEPVNRICFTGLFFQYNLRADSKFRQPLLEALSAEDVKENYTITQIPARMSLANNNIGIYGIMDHRKWRNGVLEMLVRATPFLAQCYFGTSKALSTTPPEGMSVDCELGVSGKKLPIGSVGDAPDGAVAQVLVGVCNAGFEVDLATVLDIIPKMNDRAAMNTDKTGPFVEYKVDMNNVTDTRRRNPDGTYMVPNPLHDVDATILINVLECRFDIAKELGQIDPTTGKPVWAFIVVPNTWPKRDYELRPLQTATRPAAARPSCATTRRSCARTPRRIRRSLARSCTRSSTTRAKVSPTKRTCSSRGTRTSNRTWPSSPRAAPRSKCAISPRSLRTMVPRRRHSRHFTLRSTPWTLRTRPR